MQYYLNMFYMGLPGLMLLAFIITAIFLIINCAKFSRERRLNKELVECIACKDDVLEEFKKIRHEYNNLLQTITSFIEAEDWEGLKEYKSILLEKTHLLNRNKLTQLVKIKDKSILVIVHELFMKTEEAKIALNITIYNDIADTNSHNIEFYNILLDYIKQAYELAVKEAEEINLKISSNDNGLRLCFENQISVNSQIFTSILTKSKKHPKIGKHIFFNTFLQNDNLIQEILVTFNC
ncbi:MAG: hypothetical protein ACYDG2_09630 [Ruminiclostridium sp.]